MFAIPNVSTNDDSLTTPPITNLRPVANAGVNQTVNENTTVILNGIASDPDAGDFSKLTYLWKQIAGPAVILSNENTTNPPFTAPSVSTDRELRFLLTAKDEKGAASNNSAIVTIAVKHVNHNPVPNAGQDQIVNPGDIVTLDGSKSIDPDNDSIKYLWTQASGPSIELGGNNTATPTFTSLSNISDDTDLIFRLTVKDVKNSTGSDDVKIMIGYIPPSNQLPIANAGPDQTVDSGTAVTLDGTASSDPNGTISSYSWIQSGGPPVTVNGADTATPSFTTPTDISSDADLVFKLTVTDNKNSTSYDDVKVMIKYVPPPEQPSVTPLPIPSSTPPSAPTSDLKPLRTNIEIDQDPIEVGEEQTITVTILNGTSVGEEEERISDAYITGNITPTMESFANLNGITDNAGEFSYSWEISEDTEPQRFTVRLNAALDGFRPATAIESFQVVQPDDDSSGGEEGGEEGEEEGDTGGGETEGAADAEETEGAADEGAADEGGDTGGE